MCDHPRRRGNAHRPAPLLEQMEPRIVLSAGFAWTAEEVYLTELVNRARMDPSAEAARLGIDLSEGLTTSELARLVASEPLALNAELTIAARAHSLDMAQRGFFDHVNPDGEDPTDRAQNAGYSGVAGENIAAGYLNVDEAHRAWLESLGHRKNVFSLHDTFSESFHYDEIGVGFAFTDIAPYFDFYGQLFGTQSPSSQTYILGVVYTDADSDVFYSIGEGASDVLVEVFSAGDLTNPVASYTTHSAGNYQIAVQDGSYVVRMTDQLSGGVYSTQVTVAGENVKADGRTGEFSVLTDDHTDDDTSAATLVALDAFGNGVASGAIGTVTDADLFTFIAQGTGEITITISTDALGLDGAAMLASDRFLPLETSLSNADGSLAQVTFGVVAGEQYFISVGSFAGLTTGDYVLTISGAGAGVTTHPGDPTLAGSADVIRAAAATGGAMNAVVIEQNGLPIVYERNANGDWTSTNLLDIAGGAPAIGTAQSFVDPSDGFFYVAVPTAQGLMLYKRDAGGEWSLRNLTAEDPQSRAVTDQLVFLESPTGTLHLAGLDSSGDLLLYTQTGATLSGGDHIWQMEDLANDHLRANGFTMPSFEGELISYVTSWAGLNVVGLDSSGQLWAVWWSPGLDNWHADNLSAITGAPALSGGLSAYLTSWNGINITGTDTNGDVSVTWWVPSFGADWQSSNLTGLVSGPQLDSASITSYVTPWGGLNVAGLDSAGNVVVYWWVPGFDTWRYDPIVINGSTLPEGDLTGISSPEGVLNLFGTDGAGDLVRYFWDPNGASFWSGENISQLAA